MNTWSQVGIIASEMEMPCAQCRVRPRLNGLVCSECHGVVQAQIERRRASQKNSYYRRRESIIAKRREQYRVKSKSAALYRKMSGNQNVREWSRVLDARVVSLADSLGYVPTIPEVMDVTGDSYGVASGRRRRALNLPYMPRGTYIRGRRPAWPIDPRDFAKPVPS